MLKVRGRVKRSAFGEMNNNKKKSFILDNASLYSSSHIRLKPQLLKGPLSFWCQNFTYCHWLKTLNDSLLSHSNSNPYLTSLCFSLCLAEKESVAFVEISKKQGGKGIPSHFIWSKNADAVVKEYRRKSGGKSEIMITVLTWFTERFLWSRSSVTGAISSFDSFYPNVFLFPVLHLPFTGPTFCGSCWC